MAFPHLRLLAIERGRAKLQGGGKEAPEVKANKANRHQHAGLIRQKLGDITAYWQRVQLDREQRGLPPIPGGIPFLLRIPERAEELLYRLEKDFGVTIVAQFEEGFLMVASEDISLAAFQQLTTEFENEVHGATAMASILDVYDYGRSDDRLKKILSPELFAIWPLVDTNTYILDVSIQTAGLGTEVSNPPKKRKKETQEEFEHRKQEWEAEWRATEVKWDEKQIETEDDLGKFLRPYGGQIIDQVGGQPTVEGGVVKLPDSFSVRIRMSGQGFIDLIKNYARVFEGSLPEDIEQPDPIPQMAQPGDYPAVGVPQENAPAVCVIDSGIQEGHRLLQPAIDTGNSRSFLPGQDVADRVVPDGHGTPVAGAVLYRDFVPGNQSGEAVCWIQNARLLNDQKAIPPDVYPPLALREIITYYRNGNRRTRIFNHSIAANGPCRPVR
ncbi:MAG: S8 family serine peptidase, partial [Thiobacillaceae bacterium]